MAESAHAGRGLLHPATILLLVWTTALLVVSCGGNDRRTPTDLVQAYVAAAASGRERELLELIPADFNASREVAEKIQLWRGADIAAVQIESEPNPVSPYLIHVRLSAPTVRDEIDVQQFGDRWYVMLGKKRGFSPGPTAATR